MRCDINNPEQYKFVQLGGKSVITFEWKETRNHGENVMFETPFSRRVSPFRRVATARVPISPTSSGVTSCGPKPKKVSKLFARVRYRGFFRRVSSAVMSSIVVSPATTDGASSSETFFASRPMMRPSSASPVTRPD
jgi:hypothetical protein